MLTQSEREKKKNDRYSERYLHVFLPNVRLELCNLIWLWALRVDEWFKQKKDEKTMLEGKIWKNQKQI